MNAYRIELIEPAMRADGSGFTDRDVHRHLRAKGIKNPSHEWFKCTVAQVRAAVVAVRERTANIEDRTLNFSMRPEQREAVEMTANYFRKAATEQAGPTPTSTSCRPSSNTTRSAPPSPNPPPQSHCCCCQS